MCVGVYVCVCGLQKLYFMIAEINRSIKIITLIIVSSIWMGITITNTCLFQYRVHYLIIQDKIGMKYIHHTIFLIGILVFNYQFHISSMKLHFLVCKTFKRVMFLLYFACIFYDFKFLL